MSKFSSLPDLDWMNPILDPAENFSLPTVVLYGDTGPGLHGWNLSQGGPPGDGSGGGSAPVTNLSGTGLVINVSYDSSVASAPAGFTAVVNQVVQYLESQFSDPVTINIAVGYGEVGGSNLPGGALGASSTYLSSFSYSAIKNALAADSKTTVDASAVASLPGSDPTGGNWWVTTAEGKALGLIAPNTSIDGNIGFSSGGLFDYNNADGVTAGLYDFYGVVEHEISEVMGRILLTGSTIGFFYFNSNDAYDLFHFSSTGVHTFSASTPGYFSADNGATHINTFNTNPGGDAGDWKGDTVDADNAFATSGVVLPVSTGDLTALDAIGWDGAPPPPPTPGPDITVSNFALSFTTTGGTANFHVNNIGTDPALTTSTAGLYLSGNGINQLLGNPAFPTPALDPGKFDPESVSFSLPTNLTPGTYNLSVIADTGNAVTETNEANNVSNALPVILGNDSGNTLTGTTGNDTIFGFGGNDTLTGGKGADLLIGGAGSDRFVYSATTDSSPGTPDVITDFVHASDIIDLSAIDANTSRFARGNQAFTWGGNNTAVVAHAVTWYESGGNTIIQADVNGNTTADLVIVLTGTGHGLTASDFVL